MEGIRDPLVVWKKADGSLILLDGHNRMKISAEHGGIPYQIVEKEFESREEALVWIFRNQIGRRNLSAYDRSVLALRLKPLIAEKAKQQQASHSDQGYQKTDKPVHTSKQLATIAGVSHDTIHKVEAIQDSADPHLIDSVRSGDVSISQAYTIVKGRDKSPAQQKKEFIEQAKQTHEQVSSSQVVTIADAKADKEARKTICADLWLRCLNMGKPIEAIHIEASEGDIDLGMMAKEINDDDYQILLHAIASIESALTYIKKGVRR